VEEAVEEGAMAAFHPAPRGATLARMFGDLRAGSATVALACALAIGCASAPPPAAAAPGPKEEPVVVPPKQVIHQPLSADGIAFERGREIIRDDSSAALDDLAAAIGKGDDGARAMVRVTIQPDPFACEGMTLASKRAKAIRDALIERGVPPRRVAAEGIGDKAPNCAPVTATRSSVVIELVD
jgi:hypothetical protein